MVSSQLVDVLENVFMEHITHFIDALAEKYSLPKEELVALWTSMDVMDVMDVTAKKKNDIPVAKGDASSLLTPPRKSPSATTTTNDMQKTMMIAGVSSPQKSSSSSSSSPTPMRKSAYVVFCNVKRPQLRHDHPSMTFGALSKELGRLWRTMSPDEKKVYAAEPVASSVSPVPHERIPPDRLEKATLVQLRNECAHYDIKRAGKKTALIERLQEYYASTVHIPCSIAPRVHSHVHSHEHTTHEHSHGYGEQKTGSSPPRENVRVESQSVMDVENGDGKKEKVFMFKDDHPPPPLEEDDEDDSASIPSTSTTSLAFDHEDEDDDDHVLDAPETV